MSIKASSAVTRFFIQDDGLHSIYLVFTVNGKDMILIFDWTSGSISIMYNGNVVRRI